MKNTKKFLVLEDDQQTFKILKDADAEKSEKEFDMHKAISIERTVNTGALDADTFIMTFEDPAEIFKFQSDTFANCKKWMRVLELAKNTKPRVFGTVSNGSMMF